MGQCPPVGLSLVVIVNPSPFSPLTRVTATVCIAFDTGLLLGLTGTSMPDIALSLFPEEEIKCYLHIKKLKSTYYF